jgi:small subunit ribosomal protein S15
LVANTEDKRTETIKQFQRHAKDVGSQEVQVALLTKRIERLTEHLIQHKHDNSTRRGLIHIVNHRRKLLSYLRSTDRDKHREVTSKLKITSR